ncbi:MAG: CRISPR-associated endonuclease Cas2 [Endomicrobiia bacterium]
MYIISVYDIEEKRVAKVCKLFRRYLNWVQKSVFEGELSKGKFEELKSHLKKVIDIEKDSVIFYCFEINKYSRKEIIGKEFNPLENIL